MYCLEEGRILSSHNDHSLQTSLSKQTEPKVVFYI